MLRYTETIAKDPDTREMNSNVSRVFTSLYTNPLLANPTIIKGLAFTSGTDLTVNHKLGRVVLGYLTINSNAPAIVYQSSTINIAPTTGIILKSNADAIVDILFF